MKRIVSLILVLILIFGICGCNENKTPVTSSKPKDQTSDTGSIGDEQNESPEEEKTDDNVSNKYESNDETVTLVTVPTPGMENWSTDSGAYTLTVSNESIGKFSYMGWYLTEEISKTYRSMNTSQKEQLLKYIFEEEQINYVCIIVDQRFYYQSQKTGMDITHFIESWYVGDGGILDEISKRKIPVFATIGKVPGWMQGSSPNWIKNEYIDDFSKMLSNMVYDLYTEVGLNVVNVGLGDEPDGFVGGEDSRCVSHFSKVVPLVRKHLDKKGFKNVGIIGPETCVIRPKWLNTLRSDRSIWDNLFAFSGHDFGTGTLNKTLFYQSRVTGKPLYLTSVGNVNEQTVAGNFFTKNKNGVDTVADYYTAMRDTSLLISDVNLGANVITLWAPLANISGITALDGKASNFIHLYYSPNSNLFSTGFATSANFDYYSQALQTVKPGAKIYQCSTDKEGIMSGTFDDCTLNASAGINSDGTWGINIFNKTDSEIAAPYKNMSYATIPQFARTITVNIDIVGLYGTGAKQFKMYSANIFGGSNEEVGTVTLVDGRGYIEVYPTELISLRSVESIPLNNKPLAIREEIKDLVVAFESSSYMLKNGRKVILNQPLEIKYYDDYKSCAIRYECEDFAKIIGAEYEISGNTVRIYNGVGTLTFTLGDNFAKYSGTKIGSINLAEKAVIKEGKMYFVLNDAVAGVIGNIFGIEYMQYEATGLIVVGKTDVVNIGRFSSLFN